MMGRQSDRTMTNDINLVKILSNLELLATVSCLMVIEGQNVKLSMQGSGRINSSMLQIFIAVIVISFLILFALMSLPMTRQQDAPDEKRKTQPFKSLD
jgi:hypothetical protein